MAANISEGGLPNAADDIDLNIPIPESGNTMEEEGFLDKSPGFSQIDVDLQSPLGAQSTSPPDGVATPPTDGAPGDDTFNVSSDDNQAECSPPSKRSCMGGKLPTRGGKGNSNKAAPELKPRTSSRDTRILERITEQFSLLREDKLLSQREVISANKENVQLQLQQDREQQALSREVLREQMQMQREEMVLSRQHEIALQERKYEHEMRLFGGLFEMLKSMNEAKARQSSEDRPAPRPPH